MAKGIVRKLLEIFGGFVLARQMTGCAAAEAFAEEAVVMLIESGFVGGGGVPREGKDEEHAQGRTQCNVPWLHQRRGYH